jgi:4-amino-4-deoxyprephenate dehydrogenase
MNSGRLRRAAGRSGAAGRGTAICEHRTVSERACEPLLARVAVVGGRGAVGRLFAGALADAGCDVLAIDRAGGEPPASERVPGEPPASERVPGEPRAHGSAGGERAPDQRRERGRVRSVQLDVERPSAALRDALADADAVVLALPETAALRALPVVLGALRPGALLADTLSVKGPFAAAVREAGAPVEALSLNPMFAPALGFAGRPVLAVELAGGPRTRALVALLESWGARVVGVAADEHDALAAALQVAPHAALLAFGGALARLGADLDALLAVAPPPFLALLALVARIASAASETYWDVQDANPRAAQARAALAGALAELDAAAQGHDFAAFEALLGSVEDLLGEQREPLAELAAALVARAVPAGPASPAGPS